MIAKRELVLTRWPIIVRDYLGSDTLRGMSGDGEMLFVRLCLDQWEHGVAKASKEHWRRAHGARCHDFDAAWCEATAPFTKTDDGLVHPRVDWDRRNSMGQIQAKADGARRDIVTRHRDAHGRLVPKTAPGILVDSSRSAPGEVQVDPSSASASASASEEEKNPPLTPPEEGKKLVEPQPEIPSHLATPEFVAAWDEWLAYRKRMHFKPWLPQTTRSHFKEWVGWGPARAAAAIRFTVLRQYQGIVEPKPAGPPQRAAAPSAPVKNLDSFFAEKAVTA